MIRYLVLLTVFLLACNKPESPVELSLRDHIRAGDQTGSHIFYHEIQPVPQLFSDNYLEPVHIDTYDLDINQDGSEDFTFERVRKHGETYDSLFITVTPLGNNSIQTDPTFDFLRPIPLFEEINDTGHWSGETTLILTHFVNNADTIVDGLWFGSDNHFIGTRIEVKEGLSFGWISMNIGETWGNTMAIFDFATIIPE